MLARSGLWGMPKVAEDGDSFAANAQLKAEALRKLAPPDARCWPTIPVWK